MCAAAGRIMLRMLGKLQPALGMSWVQGLHGWSLGSCPGKATPPAERCSLFCSVCLISSFRDLGMSLRCAMSL